MHHQYTLVLGLPCLNWQLMKPSITPCKTESDKNIVLITILRLELCTDGTPPDDEEVWDSLKNLLS